MVTTGYCPRHRSVFWNWRLWMLAGVSWLSIQGGAAGAIEVERTVEECSWHPMERKRDGLPCHFFAERQPYLPYQNFMVRWIDRPLYTDVRLRRAADSSRAGFFREIEILKRYGLDGFASISYLGIHDSQLRWLRDSGVKDYTQSLVLCGTPYKELLPHVRSILRFPHTYRRAGRAVFWSYGGYKMINDRMRRLRQDIRSPIVCLSPLPIGDMYSSYWKHQRDGIMPESVLSSYEVQIQQALDTCGGLHLWHGDLILDGQGEYGYRWVPSDLYRKNILPLVQRMLSLERNRDKFLGVVICHGYTNHLNGTLNRENGTEKLRRHLEEGLRCNPDMVLLFEWNEANENTSFQPTVANGRALERIVNYYKQRINQVPHVARPGDDVARPNLIVSVRQEIVLGENVHVELLNVPDGTWQEGYGARLILRDQDGKLVFASEPEEFSGGCMKAISYRLPSTACSGARAITPSVEIITHQGETTRYEGFDCTRISPSVTVNYKYSRMALRELLIPKKSVFQVRRLADGTYHCLVSLDSPDVLSSLEIMEGYRESRALDIRNEFDRSSMAIFQGNITTCIPSKIYEGRISITGSSGWFVRSAHSAWNCFYDVGLKDQVHHFKALFESTISFLVSVPLKELPQAEFRLHVDSVGDFRANLGKVWEDGRHAQLMSNQAHLTLSRLERLPDYPEPLGRKHGVFESHVRSHDSHPVFQVRAVTASGKIYRSAPQVPVPLSQPSVPARVYSDFHRGGVDCLVPERYFPELDYEFSPRFGKLLACDSSSQWDATLGGGWTYAAPLWYMRHGFFPKQFNSVSPVWKEEGKSWYLEFDGKGNYLVFPQEVIPRGTPFQCSFEIRAESKANQVLLRSGAGEFHSALDLFIEGGCLKAAYYGMDSQPKVFRSRLRIPLGTWCRISVQKDIGHLVLSVNDEEETFPCERRGKYFHYYTFGGNLNKGAGLPPEARFFKGALRRFSVKHHGMRDGSKTRE